MCRKTVCECVKIVEKFVHFAHVKGQTQISYFFDQCRDIPYENVVCAHDTYGHVNANVSETRIYI